MGIEYDQKLCQYLYTRFGMKHRRKMLDVGCGTGNHVKSFRRLGLHVWGVDKIAKGHFMKTIDLEKDILPFSDNTFDYVFCKSVLEHIRYGHRIVDEIDRVLKLSGFALIMIPVVNKYWRSYPEHINQLYPDKAKEHFLNGRSFYYELFYQFPFVWRYPFLKFIPKLIAKIVPDRFRFHKDGTQNVLVRHSKEPVWLIWVKK